MPRRKTSLKRKRADKKRHLRNLKIKKELKKALKKFQALVSTKNIPSAAPVPSPRRRSRSSKGFRPRCLSMI